jgi:hypothetical protein
MNIETPPISIDEFICRINMEVSRRRLPEAEIIKNSFLRQVPRGQLPKFYDKLYRAGFIPLLANQIEEGFI